MLWFPLLLLTEYNSIVRLNYIDPTATTIQFICVFGLCVVGGVGVGVVFFPLCVHLPGTNCFPICVKSAALLLFNGHSICRIWLTLILYFFFLFLHTRHKPFVFAKIKKNKNLQRIAFILNKKKMREKEKKYIERRRNGEVHKNNERTKRLTNRLFVVKGKITETCATIDVEISLDC